MEKKLNKKELEKLIREKIQEHEYLTRYQGNNDGLDEETKEKSTLLYKEIEALIERYIQICNKRVKK